MISEWPRRWVEVQLAGMNASWPPRAATSAPVYGRSAFRAVNPPTQVVPNWVTSGPSPLVMAVLSRVNASFHCTWTGRTVMFG